MSSENINHLTEDNKTYYTRCQVNAEKKGLSKDLDVFPSISRVAYDNLKMTWIGIYTYALRLGHYTKAQLEKAHVAYAYFDPTCCLLGLWGCGAVIESLAMDGITIQTDWSLDSIGPSAVSVGQEYQITTVSSGKMNYINLLKKYTIYYAPISATTPYEPNKLVKYGGVAYIVPCDKENPNLEIALAAVSHDLILNIHYFQIYHKAIQKEKNLFLQIETNLFKDRSFIYYYNIDIFIALGIQPGNLYFRPVDELIDPVQENEYIWSIIREKKSVKNVSMELILQGKPIVCTISTELINQEVLGVNAICIYLTIPHKTQHPVFEKKLTDDTFSFDNIIGKSPNIKSAIQRSKLLAKTTSNVMLLGESGTGKDIFAQAMHNASDRRTKPFIAVNCGALPRELIASELFGYDTGAFTGAKRQGNIGKFEAANGGTLFLDEIGELPMELQATLLRVVEQKQLTRLGSNKVIPLDVHIISATNVDIPKLIEEKKFRADLFYRLNTMNVKIPPLRDRGNDVLLLAEYFIQKLSMRSGKGPNIAFSDDARQLLLTHRWAGNVRELQTVMERIVQLCYSSVITAQDVLDNLDSDFTEQQMSVITQEQAVVKPTYEPVVGSEPQRKRHKLTQEKIQEALDACGGNHKKAAEYLGVHRATFYRYLQRFRD